MSKKVLIALRPGMLEQIDYIAKCEHRSRSDLIRESLRRYLENFRRTQGTQIKTEHPQPQQQQHPGETVTSIGIVNHID